MPKSFSLVDLTAKTYAAAIRRLSSLRLRGTILYDALHLEAALLHRCTVLLTLNPADFARLAQGTKIRITDVMRQKG